MITESEARSALLEQLQANDALRAVVAALKAIVSAHEMSLSLQGEILRTQRDVIDLLKRQTKE